MDRTPPHRLPAARSSAAASGTVRRRLALAAAAAATVALGLLVHFLVAGGFWSLVADALYTVLIYLVLALIAPAAGKVKLAVAAFAASALVELTQLTGIPHQLAQDFPPSRLILGTTFSALDLAAYAAGAAAVCCADRVHPHQGARWRPAQTE